MEKLYLAFLVTVPLLFAPGCPTMPTGGDGGADLSVAARVPKQHRASAAACSMDRAPGPDVGMGRGNCRVDRDCTMGQNGRCVPSRIGNVCSYDTCFDDSACAGKVCLCRPAGEMVSTIRANQCLSLGGCRTDGDCGAGGFCSPSFGSCGAYSGVIAFFCHTAKDECVDDEDCQMPDGGLGTPGYCMYSPMGGKWVCSSSLCAG